jgi:peptide/nickel transport system substrate-binding protein
MKKGVFWILLTSLVVISVVLSSCSSATTTSTTTSTTGTTTTKTSIMTTSTTAITTSTPASTTTTAATATTTTSTGNWWDSLGTPRYGGTITIQSSADITNFDPYNASALPTVMGGWLELFYDTDWTLSPAVFDYKLTILNPAYYTPHLATGWEFSDPSTFVVHLRHDVYWQNIAPMNGRQFVAADIVYHYDRQYGIGDGFTTRDPNLSLPAAGAPNLISCTNPDNFTVFFGYSMPNPAQILQSIEGLGCTNDIEAPEIVQQNGNTNNWHQAIGTGPFILTDFVSGGSATMVRNPTYWGTDERHTQNKLPYVDKLQVLVIPQAATALAAVRAGKISIMGGLSWTQAQAMQSTNPEITQINSPPNTALTLDPRDDLAPYNNLNVRIALQEAINLPLIASTYYGGTVSPLPSSLTSIYQNGGGFPFSSWPAALQAQYTYNPTGAKQLLASAGFPNGFNTDVIADNSADLTLLQIIQSELAAVNINMSINLMDTATWTSTVMTGHKADALAFRAGSGALGQTQPPTSQLNRFRTGVSYNYMMVTDPKIDNWYTQAMAATDPNVILQILEQENEYMAAQHFSISLLSVNSYNLCVPQLKGYNGQAQAIGNNAVNIGFYGARCWLTQ